MITVPNIIILTFLEPKDVNNCFIEDLMSESPIDKILQKSSNHFVQLYVSEDCFYPSKLWALTSSERTHTTNASK